MDVTVYNPTDSPAIRKDGKTIAGRDWATLPMEQVQHLIERNRLVVLEQVDTTPQPEPVPVVEVVSEPEPIIEPSKAVGDEPDDNTPESPSESEASDAPEEGVVDNETASVPDTMSKTTARRSRAKKES